MILDVLVFVLGFCAAGLLALAVLPAVWRRALRLSEERLSRLVPLSAEEIAAERDHLRAEHAVELRRAEQRCERAEGSTAALRVDLARREARIDALGGDVAARQVRVAALEAERAALRREADELWAEQGAERVALDGLARLAESRLEMLAELQTERTNLELDRDRLQVEVDSGRGRAAALETRLMGAEARGEDLERDLAEARRRLASPPEPSAPAPAAGPAEAPAPPPSPDGVDARLAERDREIEGLRVELAFMGEQAASAERRAAEAARSNALLLAARRAGAEPAP